MRWPRRRSSCRSASRSCSSTAAATTSCPYSWPGYADRARAAGDDLDLEVDERAGHFEHLDPRSGVWAAVRTWLDRRLP